MATQAEFWDQGDVHGFMQGYTEDVCFLGTSGRSCGKQAVTQDYLRRYPDQASMGHLAFEEMSCYP
jgi:ketosteroid isomerase-like protein